jgi:3-dehydroquinate dehydratase-1
MGLIIFAMKPLLTIPIHSGNTPDREQQLRAKRPEVQAYEIWLDALEMKELNPVRVKELVRRLKKLTKKKLVIVCKDQVENGRFSRTPAAKVELLAAAASAGADYIDIGLHTGKKWIETLVKKKKKAKLILSFHDFEKTPPVARLRSLAERMKELGADIIKIATFSNTLEDTQQLIELALQLKKKKQKHIILGMGEKGMVTRILGQKLGNELQFVSLGVSTAPGQMSLEEMVQFNKILNFE